MHTFIYGVQLYLVYFNDINGINTIIKLSLSDS